VIEGDHGVATFAEALDGRAVDENDVEPAIIIAIEKAGAAAGRINNVVGLGSSDVRGGDPDLLRDVSEDGNGRESTAIGFRLGYVRFCNGWRDGNALRPGSLREREVWDHGNET